MLIELIYILFLLSLIVLSFWRIFWGALVYDLCYTSQEKFVLCCLWHLQQSSIIILFWPGFAVDPELISEPFYLKCILHCSLYKENISFGDSTQHGTCSMLPRGFSSSCFRGQASNLNFQLIFNLVDSFIKQKISIHSSPVIHLFGAYTKNTWSKTGN